MSNDQRSMNLDAASAQSVVAPTETNATKDQAYALERMQLALDAGRTGVWDWNLITGEVHLDGRVRQLWGFDDTTPASLDIFRNALHPQDRKRSREAVETALKMARAYHAVRGEAERDVVIGRRGSYHGNTVGALDASGQESCRARQYFRNHSAKRRSGRPFRISPGCRTSAA